MQEALLEHERRMLVLSYLEARAHRDEDRAAEIRSYADDDPELGCMLGLEDAEYARRLSRDAPLMHLAASLFDRLFGQRT